MPARLPDHREFLSLLLHDSLSGQAYAAYLSTAIRVQLALASNAFILLFVSKAIINRVLACLAVGCHILAPLCMGAVLFDLAPPIAGPQGTGGGAKQQAEPMSTGVIRNVATIARMC
jgi:hypothetical protein